MKHAISNVEALGLPYKPLAELRSRAWALYRRGYRIKVLKHSQQVTSVLVLLKQPVSAGEAAKEVRNLFAGLSERVVVAVRDAEASRAAIGAYKGHEVEGLLKEYNLSAAEAADLLGVTRSSLAGALGREQTLLARAAFYYLFKCLDGGL